MGQKPGRTGNPNGRPKGSQNKITKTTKEWIAGLIDQNRKQVERDLKKLEPKDRIAMIEKLLQYVIPKASTVNINLERLNDQQLDQLIDEMINKLD